MLLVPTLPSPVPRLLAATLAAVVLACGLAATARASTVDVSSTHALISDYDAMIRARQAALAPGVAAVDRYVAAVGHGCQGVLAHAPMTGAEAQALGGEVSGAVGLALIGPTRPALLAFVRAVGSLLWSDPAVARAVGSFAGAVLGYARLGTPDVCADLRAWAASGYRTVPGTTRAFNADVTADANQQASAIPAHALAPYVTSADARIAAQTEQRAAAYQRAVGAEVLPPLNRLLLVLGVH